MWNTSLNCPPGWQRRVACIHWLLSSIAPGLPLGWNSLRLSDCTCTNATMSEKPWGGKRQLTGTAERRRSGTSSMGTQHVQSHGSALGLIHSCYCLRILNTFIKRGLSFSFYTGISKLYSSLRLLDYFAWSWYTAWSCTMSRVKKLFPDNVRSGRVGVWCADLVFIISLWLRCYHLSVKMKKQIQVR